MKANLPMKDEGILGNTATGDDSHVYEDDQDGSLDGKIHRSELSDCCSSADDE